MSKKTKGFPFDHVINEETKTIEITWSGNGYVGRMAVPSMVKRYYPGYSYIFVS
jgi:hypothetical protein